MDKIKYKSLTTLSVLLLFFTAATCLYTGKYLHPLADDYVYGADTRQTWLNTHSISACIQSALETTANIYDTWQGTYTGIFLMSMQPGVFGYYYITPLLLTGCLIISTYLLMFMIMIKLLHTSRREYIFVSTVFVLINMQFLYSVYDAFYWYNGGMYYILFYSLSLLLASLLIAYQQCGGKLKKALIATGAILDCIIIGGGNFISGFGTATVLLAFIIVYTAEKKHIPVFCTIVLAVFAIAFAFSVLAPGNTFREADQQLANPDFKPSIPYGIAVSIFRSSIFTLKSMLGFMPIAFLALLPVVSRIAKRSDFNFSHPWLCIVTTCAIYITVFFPHCYATNYVGPDRVRNIYRFSLFWLILINMFYLSGAVIRKSGTFGAYGHNIYCKIRNLKCCRKWVNSNKGFTMALILVLTTFAPESTAVRNMMLLGGTIQKSDKEMDEREKLLEEETEKDTIFVKPLSVALPSDAYTDAKTPPGDWVNEGIAKYYGKKEVYAEPLK